MSEARPESKAIEERPDDALASNEALEVEAELALRSQRAEARTFADDVAEAQRRHVKTRATTGTGERPSFADQFFRKGAEAREAFAYISEHTGDVVDDEADDWIQHYYISKVQGLSACFVVAVVVGVIGIVVGNFAGAATISMIISWLASFVVLAGLIVLVMISITKKRIFGRVASTLDSARDPLVFCSRYLAYLRERDPSEMVVAIWNYARGLRWQGRWDDAEALFEAYIDDYGMLADPKSQYLHHQLLAGIAFDHERCQDLLDELYYLKSIPAEALGADLVKEINLTERLAEVLCLEREGRRQEAYDLVESFFYHSENVLRMALALHLGSDSPNRTDALEWIGFVVKMGMSTWCVKRAKAIRSSGKLQKLPKGESRFGRNFRERRREARQKRRAAKEAADAEQTLENLPELPR